MTYYVTVENGTANRYTATVIGWPNCVAEGTTREEAVARVKQRFTERLHQVEIVPIEVESTHLDLTMVNAAHPWAQFAGMQTIVSALLSIFALLYRIPLFGGMSNVCLCWL